MRRGNSVDRPTGWISDKLRKTTCLSREFLIGNPFVVSGRKSFQIDKSPAMGIWPRGLSHDRGDLGCLARLAKEAGYRADELAARLQVSTRLLRRVFQDDLGISLKSWLVEARAVEIRRLLLGRESIAEIAASVGFSHPKEMAREFRKIHGMTPSDYRNHQRNPYLDQADDVRTP